LGLGLGVGGNFSYKFGVIVLIISYSLADSIRTCKVDKRKDGAFRCQFNYAINRQNTFSAAHMYIQNKSI